MTATAPTLVSGTTTARDLIEATSITINWTEAGPFENLTLTGTNVWAQANVLLTMFLSHARSAGRRGYVKTNFTVEWADGETYTGRIDLGDAHQGAGEQSLGRHIRGFVACVASGRLWFPQEHRAALLAFPDSHQIIA